MNINPTATKCRTMNCPSQPINCGYCKEHYDENIIKYFDGFIRFLSNRNMRTIERYIYVLSWIGIDKLNALNDSASLHSLYLWMANQEGRQSFSFIKNYNLVYAALRNYLDFANKKELKDYVLKQALKKKTSSNVLKHHNRDIVELFILNAKFDVKGHPKKEFEADRDTTFMIYLSDVGARVGEAVPVQVNDLKFDNNIIDVSKYSKTGERESLMSERLKTQLRFFINKYRIQKELFDFKPSLNKEKQEIWGRYGTSVTSQEDARKRYMYFRQVQKAEYVVKNIGKSLKATKVITPHQFRHSLAMFLHKDKKMPLEKVKVILGHNSVTSTEVYAKTTVNDVRDDFKKALE